MSEKPSFFSELKRRNVYKVAVAYIIGGWALAQGIAQVFPVFDVSNWAIRLIVLLIIFGFPVALAAAWFLEITPEGIKRTATADAMPQMSGHKDYPDAVGCAGTLIVKISGTSEVTLVRRQQHQDAFDLRVLPASGCPHCR